MKKIIFCLLAILALSVFTIDARTYVLSVGVGKQGTGCNDLSMTPNDAIDFANLMKKHTNDVTMVTSANATKDNIIAKLRQIADAATEQDRIYFLFSGHGGTGLIVAYDDFITYDEIVNILNKSKSPMCVCFIDACMSGSAVTGTGNALAANGKKNVAFLTACRPEEVSFENPTIGRGVLAQSIIKGMRGKSDADGDKRITLKELFKYVYNDVVKRTGPDTQYPEVQHPQLIAPANIQEAALVVWK